MKLLLPIAVLLSACSSVPRAPESVQRVCHEAQARFNVPLKVGELGHCLPFARYVTPQLRESGATDLRWLTMGFAESQDTHIALRFRAEGRDWLCDNRRLAHAFGRTPQEEVEYFVNPFHEATANVTLISP